MQTQDPNLPPSLRRSLRLVILGGCLFMLYNTGTMSPAFTEYFRSVGASEIHFGLIGGVPLVMLSMQFVAAALVNRIRRRKPLFLCAYITSRLLFVPIVFLPLWLSGVDRHLVFGVVIALLAVSAGLSNIGGTVWLSWMADMIPSRVLNTYWGVRHRWMYLSWTAAYVFVAVVTRTAPIPVTRLYPAMVLLAVVLGVSDIVLFFWVDEPPNTRTEKRSVLSVLLEPFRHEQFRTFVLFSCAWQAAVMFGAAFMQLYAFKVLGLPVWQMTIIWCVIGIGNALAAGRVGRLADKHGHRPILTLCVTLKPLIVIVFMILTPRTALWVLPVAFFFDSMLNAGLIVASNGYMMKIAPRENRSMFLASIAGFAGICGGLAAILGGTFLQATNGFALDLGRWHWTNYHLLFSASVVLRASCLLLAIRIREPRSTASRTLLYEVTGVWPLRFLRFPVGLYRAGRGLVLGNHGGTD